MLQSLQLFFVVVAIFFFIIIAVRFGCAYVYFAILALIGIIFHTLSDVGSANVVCKGVA